MKKAILFTIIVLVLVGGYFLLFYNNPINGDVYKTQEECERNSKIECYFKVCDNCLGRSWSWEGWIPVSLESGDRADYLTCRTDNECTISGTPINSCCFECSYFAINIIGEEEQAQWRENNCGIKEKLCPKLKCLKFDKIALCINNQCQLNEKVEPITEEIKFPEKYTSEEECETKTEDQCFYYECNKPILSDNTLYKLLCKDSLNEYNAWYGHKQAQKLCHKWCDDTYGEPPPPSPYRGISIEEACPLGCITPLDIY